FLQNRTHLLAIGRQLTPRRPRLESGPVAFLVLLAAAAGAWIVAAGLLFRDGLLLLGGCSTASDELQRGHFLVLFALDVAGEVLDDALSGAALVGIVAVRPVGAVAENRFPVLIFVLFVFVEGQDRLRARSGHGALGNLQEEQIPDGLVFNPIHH